MTIWQILFWTIVALAALASLYGLHRFCLKLEERGYLYYWHKKPSGSSFGAFSPLQEALQPQIQHVYRIHEERPRQDEADAQGDPKEPDSNERKRSEA